jgi:nicotinate-nucleotide adenylyltransferase
MSERIALYGGSFDPIHHGHLISARALAEELGLSRVVFLPSASPPHKDSSKLSPVSDRAAMVRLAIAGEPHFDYDDHDMTRLGPTYTVDTVEHFRRELGEGVRLYWIIGADSLLELSTWHRASELVDSCCMVTAVRPGWSASALDPLREMFSAEQVERLRSHVFSTPEIDVSATDIRSRVRCGRSIRYLVPDCVADYIREHGLYLHD